MANPQCENGYTKIANELFDALIARRMPGEQRQVFDFILRKTYGWGKKKDAISLSQFVEATGIKKQNVLRCLKTLNGRNIISVIKSDNGYTTSYGIKKDYTRWKALSKKITLSKQITSVIKTDNKPLSKMIPTKEKKETITKDKYLEDVLLSKEQYKKLIVKFRSEENLKAGIQILNNYKMANGKTYKSDYHAMIGWVFDRVNKENKPTAEAAPALPYVDEVVAADPEAKKRDLSKIPQFREMS